MGVVLIISKVNSRLITSVSRFGEFTDTGAVGGGGQSRDRESDGGIYSAANYNFLMIADEKARRRVIN